MGNICGRQTRVDGEIPTGCLSGNITQPSANPPGNAQVFLEQLGLGIYSQAFRLAGFDDVAQLQALTQQELALAIERHSHVPILPGHAQKILQAAACHARDPSLAANDAEFTVHVTRSRPATPGQPGPHTLMSKEPPASRVTLPSPRPAGPQQPSAAAAAAAAAAGAAGAAGAAAAAAGTTTLSVHCLPPAAAARPGPTAAPAAGPLTANRTARGASGAARPPPPPPAATLRRPQPTAWAELAGEVSGLSLAATASLAGSTSGSRQPSPRGVSLPGALAAHAPVLTTPRQSDPGLAGQQQLLQQRRTSGPGMGPTPPAAAGGSFHLADLPPSVQQLHEKMLGRLRAQGSSSSTTAADMAGGGGLLTVSGEPSGSSLPPVAEHSSGREAHTCRLAWPAEQQPAGSSSSRPHSAAGSSCVAGSSWDVRPGSSASTRGAAAAAARASDVSSIVQQARERVAARHRLPALQNTIQQQQQLGTPPAVLQGGASTAAAALRAPAAHLSRAGSSSGGGVLSPRHQQQAAAAAAGLLLQGERSGAARQQQQQHPEPCLLAESSIARACADVTVSAAFRDGERKMRMLQEYRAIGELDSAIQARVQQLSHQTTGRPAAAAGACSGGGGGSTSTAAAAGCWRPGMAPAGADTAKKAAEDCHLEPVPSASPLLFKKRHAAAAASGGAAGGLLGINEALNNSFDCGQVNRGNSGSGRGRAGALAHTVAAAAAGQQQNQQQQIGSAHSRLASGGSGVKSSRPSTSSTSKAAAATGRGDSSSATARVDAYFACQDNPFVSPEASPSSGCAADDNPFLRESLVLQPVQAFGCRS